MLTLSHSLLIAGIAMFAAGTGILGHDTLELHAQRRTHAHGGAAVAIDATTTSSKWRTSAALTLLAWAPLVISIALLVELAG
jgi:hypothetical protein